jgi:Holliday junction resolvasome RuvABC endonuclease subunit
MKILALDMSSTTIGVCYDGEPRLTIRLKGPDIASRCQQAQHAVANLIAALRDIDLVAVEAPASRFNGALIPQARVSGAALVALCAAGVAWREISPAAAKRTLTGKGNATKGQMIAAAQTALGGWELDEHAADAYGLWRAAQALRVEVAV